MASNEYDLSLGDVIKQKKKGGKNNNNSPNIAKNQQNSPKKPQQQQQSKNGRKFKLNRNGLYSGQLANSSPKKGKIVS